MTQDANTTTDDANTTTDDETLRSVPTITHPPQPSSPSSPTLAKAASKRFLQCSVDPTIAHALRIGVAALLKRKAAHALEDSEATDESDDPHRNDLHRHDADKDTQEAEWQAAQQRWQEVERKADPTSSGGRQQWGPRPAFGSAQMNHPASIHAFMNNPPAFYDMMSRGRPYMFPSMAYGAASFNFSNQMSPYMGQAFGGQGQAFGGQWPQQSGHFVPGPHGDRQKHNFSLNNGIHLQPGYGQNMKPVRRKRRKIGQLSMHELWFCPHLCGKKYRKSSLSSIRAHQAICATRNGQAHTDPLPQLGPKETRSSPSPSASPSPSPSSSPSRSSPSSPLRSPPSASSLTS